MIKNKHSRVQRLEEKAHLVGERRFGLPLCCFYSKENRSCDCKPYFTYQPRVIGKGLNDFYKEANSGKCKTPPEDAEFVEDYFEAKDTV